MKRFEVEGTALAVYHVKGVLTATEDLCTHAEAALTDGALDCERGTVECPLHGALFDIRTGKALCLPAITPVRTFPVKVEGDALLVDLG